MGNKSQVRCLSHASQHPLRTLLGRFGMQLEIVRPGESIPGSFWGDEEAGLIGNRVYARADTPLHSILHESGHWICMDSTRRSGLHTNAQGDYDEENAVCYLQIVLSDYLPDFGRNRCMDDMDAWGYTFRLGSARAWFEHDADDALAWLKRHGIVDTDALPTWVVRG